ncbi:MAG: sterol desaturase family protein, partial [Bacteriovoracaceae bacterium]
MSALVENETFATMTVMGLFILLFALERVFPLRLPSRRLLPRLTTNFFMAGLTLVIALLLVRPSALTAMSMSSEYSFGLLNLFEGSFEIKFLFGFLLLDLSFYYWHRLNHKWPFLWRFHNTHHIDPDLDTSTAFRFHFGEVALSSIFRFAQVIVIGPTLFIYL